MPSGEPLPGDDKGEGRGTLFLVATPIGNLEDITLRAIRTLKESDLIACEDTRRTQALLEHYEIRINLISYHEHNEMTRAPELILLMEQGSRIALVSDAGTPMFSDPGYRLVKLAIRHNLPVVPVPGPSALVASLAASGLPMDQFRFLGFLPAKKGARRKSLRLLAGDSETLVFYEAPHRIVDMIEDLKDVLGDRPVAVARELTKIHEEILRGKASEILAQLKSREAVKGELTVVAGPPEAPVPSPSRRAKGSLAREIKGLMSSANLTEREALKRVARSRGVSKSELYREWQLEKGS